MDNIGYIHSTQSFGTVDGPGIRYVVFMQGCILRCKYCHNRDTWHCGIGRTVTVDKLIDDILKYKPYFSLSSGGVTISGGEPLVQVKFLTELFKKLKMLNIHTALDTSGSVPITEDVKEALKYTDLVLLDIKHIDNKKSVILTSKSNKYNIEFAKYLGQNNIPVWIRQVIIPGYTDSKEDLLKLRAFLGTLNNIKKVELLPYHDMGKYKWTQLGEKYPLENIRNATDEDIKKAKEILEI